MGHIWELLRNIGGVVLLVMLGIWLMGSSQAGHLLGHGEFARALDHFISGGVRVVEQGIDWLRQTGR
jgi:hypothetical protein